MTGRPYDLQAWRHLRRAFLRRYPICEECNRAPATIPHHRDGGADPARFLDITNLEPVCLTCHKRLHRMFGHRPRRSTRRIEHHGQNHRPPAVV